MRNLLMLLCLALPLAAQDVSTVIKFRFYKDQTREVVKVGNKYTFRCDGQAMDAEIMEAPAPDDLGVDEFVITHTDKSMTLTLNKDMTYLVEIVTAGGVKQQCLQGDLKTVTANVLVPVFPPSGNLLAAQ